MKTVADLKYDDIVWIVDNRGNIKEDKITSIDGVEIGTTTYRSIKRGSMIDDRLKPNSFTFICLDYKDAIQLAKQMCFSNISDLLKEIGKKAKEIDEIGQKIQDLNDLEITVK